MVALPLLSRCLVVLCPSSFTVCIGLGFKAVLLGSRERVHSPGQRIYPKQNNPPSSPPPLPCHPRSLYFCSFPPPPHPMCFYPTSHGKKGTPSAPPQNTVISLDFLPPPPLPHDDGRSSFVSHQGTTCTTDTTSPMWTLLFSYILQVPSRQVRSRRCVTKAGRRRRKNKEEEEGGGNRTKKPVSHILTVAMSFMKPNPAREGATLPPPPHHY